MKRLHTGLQRQQWAFLIYGLAFGGAMYLAQWLPGGSAIGIGPAVVGGLVFASLMSARLALRAARRDRRLSARPFQSQPDR